MDLERIQSKRIRNSLMIAFIAFSSFVCLKGILPAMENARGDFSNYYTASRLLLEGKSIEPAYRDPVWFQKQIDRYGFQNQIGGFIPHPPPTALVFTPLALMEPVAAKQLWTIFNIGLVALNIYLLSQISGLNWLITGILFLATGFGLINNFLNGQLYLLLLTSILLGLYFHKSQHPVLAGISLGSLVLVKYFGAFFLLFFLWRRQWKLIVSAAGTILVVLILTTILTDLQTLQTYMAGVLPRHLAGEIQDPFTIHFQSWNSLFRNLFLFEETLNPDPVLSSPFLFFLSKNLVFWILIAICMVVMLRIRFQDRRQTILVQLAWVPLIILLVSPAAATYHFLLLTMSIVLLVKVLLDQKRLCEALALVILFVLINYPFHQKLEPLAQGWLIPFAYSRLWLLLLFFVLSIYFFRSWISWRIRHAPSLVLLTFMLVVTTTAFSYSSSRNQPNDGAKQLTVDHPEFNRHLGLILKSPDLGGSKVVFSYSELLDGDYAIYSANGRPWTATGPRNYFRPDLADDDSSLLAETVVQGRPEIWLSNGQRRDFSFLTVGENPSWHPDGFQFVYLNDGRVFLSDIQLSEMSQLPISNRVQDISLSPGGDYLAYVAREGKGTSLRIWEFAQNREIAILKTSNRINSPAWSPDESKIVFSWDVAGNRDIWFVELATGETNRLTYHNGNDDEPVWDADNNRIVFTSDRGRGLGCSALFWLSILAEDR